MLVATLLCTVVLGGPTLPQRATAQRLEAYIVDVSPSASPYARELAERILWESSHYGLDPAMFAAIAYMESRYRLYPHGGDPRTTLGAVWQVYPTRDWLKHPRALRLAMSRSMVVSTGRAALILARHVGRGPHTPATYCRYNRTPCRRSYVVALYRTTRKIREIVWPHTPFGPCPRH